MKISQLKNYKKPLYALGLAAIMTVAVTGCTDPVGYAGDEQIMTSEDTKEYYKPESGSLYVDGVMNIVEEEPEGTN